MTDLSLDSAGLFVFASVDKSNARKGMMRRALGSHTVCIGRLVRWRLPAGDFNLASQAQMASVTMLDKAPDDALLGLEEEGHSRLPRT
jgi:hypothetical protein